MQSDPAKEGVGLTREMQWRVGLCSGDRTRVGKRGLGLCSSPTTGWDWRPHHNCSRDLSDSLGFSGFSNGILSDFNGFTLIAAACRCLCCCYCCCRVSMPMFGEHVKPRCTAPAPAPAPTPTPTPTPAVRTLIGAGVDTTGKGSY